MRDHGVTPDYVQGLMAQGLPKLSADDLVRARDHGVTPDYVQAMRQAGYGSVGVDGLVNARDHGVDPEYVKAMSTFGYSKLPLDSLVNAATTASRPTTSRAWPTWASRRCRIDALINARDHGITPDYARALRDLGYRLEIQDLVRARDHGVTPDYVKELKSLGYDQLSIDDLVALRDHGVTPDKVKRANARAGSKLPPDMLRSLADGGSLSSGRSSRRAELQFGLRIHRLNQRLDVAVAERERLILPRVVLVPRHVVGHHHVRIADLLQRPHHVEHVHVAFVREHLLEVVATAADVAEVDVEDLPARPEVADHVVNLGRRDAAASRPSIPRHRFSPWYGLAWISTNRFMPSTVPSTRTTPRKPAAGTPGSCGWQARRTLYSSATGTTRSRK